jgi:ABC-2 type transport system ATP-binding protein
MEAALRCGDLAKTYNGNVEAVRAIDLEIGVGKCFGLLASNGAEVITTIEMLEGRSPEGSARGAPSPARSSGH